MSNFPLRGKRGSGWWRKYPPSLKLGLVLVGLVIGTGILSFFWTPYDPNDIDVLSRLASPGAPGYVLGTDLLGRDIVTQIMIGARNSLYVSIISTLVAVFIGTAIGLFTAVAEPRLRSALSRVVDTAIAIPGILVALVIATIWQPGNSASIIAIVIWFVPVAARIVIGPARQILALEYIEAARSYGRSDIFILFRHVLPNISPLVIVQASTMFASGILAEAALSFIGIGAQPPTASWGRLLQDAQSVIDVAPSMMIFPGMAIAIAVLGFNLLGDGLRAHLDPRQSMQGGM